jgi:hypothetical protein
VSAEALAESCVGVLVRTVIGMIGEGCSIDDVRRRFEISRADAQSLVLLALEERRRAEAAARDRQRRFGGRPGPRELQPCNLERRALIVQLRKDGNSLAGLGRVLGISKQRVADLERDAAKRGIS